MVFLLCCLIVGGFVFVVSRLGVSMSVSLQWPMFRVET